MVRWRYLDRPECVTILIWNYSVRCTVSTTAAAPKDPCQCNVSTASPSSSPTDFPPTSHSTIPKDITLVVPCQVLPPQITQNRRYSIALSVTGPSGVIHGVHGTERLSIRHTGLLKKSCPCHPIGCDGVAVRRKEVVTSCLVIVTVGVCATAIRTWLDSFFPCNRRVFVNTLLPPSSDSTIVTHTERERESSRRWEKEESTTTRRPQEE